MKDVHRYKSNSKSPRLKQFNSTYYIITLVLSFVLPAVWLNLDQSFGDGKALSLAFGLWFSSWGMYSLRTGTNPGLGGKTGFGSTILTGKLAVAVGLFEIIVGLFFLIISLLLSV